MNITPLLQLPKNPESICPNGVMHAFQKPGIIFCSASLPSFCYFLFLCFGAKTTPNSFLARGRAQSTQL